MNFPKVFKHRVIGYSPLLTLTIKGLSDEIYIRKYYKVKYTNKSHLVFMTTNELDYSYNTRVLDYEFVLVNDFHQLVADFEKSDFVADLTSARFNGPPKYIYYNIELINEFIKPLFEAHLRDSISGFTEDDFEDIEKRQIKKWFYCIKNRDLKY